MAMQYLSDGDGRWNKLPYQVVLGGTFDSLQDALNFSIQNWGGYMRGSPGSNGANNYNKLPGEQTIDDLLYGDSNNGSAPYSSGSGRIKSIMQDIYNVPNGNYSGNPANTFFPKSFFKDTRVGANDAINCLWQFNRDDDIVHPSLYSERIALTTEQVKPFNMISAEHFGEGRVYASTTELNQTVAYFAFGVPRYNNLAKFISDSYDASLARVNDTGFDQEGVFTLGNLWKTAKGAIGASITLCFGIYIVPIKWIMNLSDWLHSVTITSFYELRLSMMHYYIYVDNMCAHWLVATGLFGNGYSEATGGDTLGNTDGKSNTGSDDADSQISAAYQAAKAKIDSMKAGGSSSTNSSQTNTTTTQNSANSNTSSSPNVNEDIANKAKELGTGPGGIQVNSANTSTTVPIEKFESAYYGQKPSSWTASEDFLPPALAANGPSIWDILSLKARILGFSDMSRNSEYNNNNVKNSSNMAGVSMQEALDKFQRVSPTDAADIEVSTQFAAPGNPPESLIYENEYPAWSRRNLADAKDVMKTTACGASAYIGFRINKSVDASETFSNSTNPSAIGSKINGQIEGMAGTFRNAKGFEFLSNQGIFGGLISKVSSVITGALNAVGSVADSILGASVFGSNLGELAEIAITGAKLNFPEEYSNSSFNKSFGLNFQLRAPYGDVVSIYQSIIIPLFLLMAGVLPRAAGNHSYQQPFLCTAYCRGIFAVPLGIFENLSVKRGASDFGWTYMALTTRVDVELTVKDLSPAVYMSMRGDKLIPKVMPVETAFEEYLNMLAGIGLFEQISSMSKLRRTVQEASWRLRYDITNPRRWGYWAGNTSLAQIAGRFASTNYIPH